MTQEDKELLLKDLSARVPYHPKGHVVNACNGAECDEWLTCATFSMFTSVTNNCRLYLRQISSMTEEEMDRLFDILHIDKDGNDEDWIKINDVCGINFFFPTGKWIENVAEAYDYLYSIHIDFRGLIHKGLAIEVTEENNPYKE